jgi:penicillin-binding protein 1A
MGLNKKKAFFTKSKFVKVSWLLFLVGWVVIVAFFLAMNLNTANLFGKSPSFEELENPNASVASRIYSADSVLLGKYFLENRTSIPFDGLSPVVTSTLMATEDIRFYEHSGVDAKGVATIPYYLATGKRRGSSTITQQLARNLYSSSTAKYDGTLTQTKFRTVIIKLKEWITAIKIEQSYTKKEIMAMYLNTVDFGSNAFGIKVAAQTYFGKEQKDLSYQEAAVLIGLLKATNAFNPQIHPERAFKRRNTVLDQLAKYKIVSQETANFLKKEPIKLSFKVENQNQGYATYFREEAKKFIQEWCKRKGYDIYRDGLVIYSTIDSRIQRYAESAVEEHLSKHQATFFSHWKGKNPWTIKNENDTYTEIKDFLKIHIKRTYAYRIAKHQFNGDTIKIEQALNTKKKMTIFSWSGEKDTLFSSYDSLAYYKHFLQTGFMAMDPSTGYIKAWVGGINYKYFKYDHVQQGKRQPGSTFKPIVYTTILGEIGEDYGPCYEALDAPVTFVTGDTANPVWVPQNSDGKYTGQMLTLRQALAQSKNSITAFMMKTLGEQTPNKVLQYATKLGINTEEFEAVPAMCLGTFDVSLYELLGAYSTFMNKGEHQTPQYIRAIYDKNGNLLEEFKPQPRIAISQELAYVMNYMLRGATTERNGTALGLNRWDLLSGNEIGAKTGTTQDYSDGWFVGMTPQLVTGCWVGCEDRVVHFRNFDYGQGARMAMPIFGIFMDKVYKDPKTGITKQRFPEPSEEEKSSFKIITDCKKFKEMRSDSAMLRSNIIDPSTIDNEFKF